MEGGGRKSVAERVKAMEEIFDKGRLTWHVDLLSDSTQEPEVPFKRHAAHPSPPDFILSR
jgi:hypothetical protein